MGKIYADVKSALEGLTFDGMTVMSGGFGLCGIPENLIAGLRDSADEDRLTATARGDGFLSFVDDGYLKARRGETALSEIHRIAGGDAGVETA